MEIDELFATYISHFDLFLFTMLCKERANGLRIDVAAITYAEIRSIVDFFQYF